MFRALFAHCPNCGNRHGFNEGCCVECGWNHRTNQYDFIRVLVADLPVPLRAPLIGKYAALFKKDE